MTREPGSGFDSLRLQDEAAQRLLRRAGELDAQARTTTSVEQLRQAAVEAGISEQAFEAALAEMQLGAARAAGERPLPLERGGDGRPRTRRRRRRFAILAAVAAAVGALLLSRMVVPVPPAPVPAAPPAPAAPAAPAAGQAYFEFQVERPVQSLNDVAPQYPAALQRQGVSGQVIAQFVVDETGRAEPASFRVIETSHALFSDAVEAALPRMRFRPAEVGGRAVRQLVQQPFVFQIGR
jgi:TonB family protein